MSADKEGLILSKGGKLLETKWVYDDAADKGSYVTKDVTSSAVRRLFDVCELEDGVTLEDIFLLLDTELDIFDAVLGNWCKEIVTEGLTQPAKAVGTYDPDGMEYLELYWDFRYDDGSEYGPSFYGYAHPQFHGIGWELREDKLAHWSTPEKPDVEWPKGSRINWGVSFTPANELIDLPVKLDTKVTVFDDNLKHDMDHQNKTGWHYPVATYTGAVYTLGNILYGVLWELSWHGGPEKRKKAWGELKASAAEIDKAIAEGRLDEVTVPASQVFSNTDDKE